MKIDKAFITTVRWIRNAQKDGWISWDYDKWITNESDYRSQFLRRLDLTFDCLPKENFCWVGSSFMKSSEERNNEDKLSRWKGFEFPGRVLELLNKNALDLLSAAERQQVKHQLDRAGEQP